MPAYSEINPGQLLRWDSNVRVGTADQRILEAYISLLQFAVMQPQERRSPIRLCMT